jgi:hypothetical protein
MPPNSNSIVTTTAGTTMEAEAAAATTAMAGATTRNNQSCTKANKAVAVGLCVPPHPTSNGRIGTIAIHMVVMLKMPT